MGFSAMLNSPCFTVNAKLGKGGHRKEPKIGAQERQVLLIVYHSELEGRRGSTQIRQRPRGGGVVEEKWVQTRTCNEKKC